MNDGGAIVSVFGLSCEWHRRDPRIQLISLTGGGDGTKSRTVDVIGIIDYGMGNLRSVQKAFELLGVQAVILTDGSTFDRVDHLVLPGVGAFADGMRHLEQRELIDPIRSFIDAQRPFIGICLGMQLLFDCSEEDSPSNDRPIAGLAALRGQVVRIAGDAYGAGKLKVPHMGWNAIHWQREDPLFVGLEPGAFVYFIHSYYAEPDGNEIVSAQCEYGARFCASVWRENIWATQFHPEKSQRVGLKMLENFAKL